MKKTKVCPGCNVTFEVKKGDREYCTDYCRRNPSSNKIKNCEFCGKQFKAKKVHARFCGDYCRISHYNGSKNILKCKTCGEEKDRAEFVKTVECIKCFASKNPRFLQKKKEEIPHFIEIESFLKKIDSQKYRARYVDLLMIVHLHADIDYFSTRMSVDDMFLDLQMWYVRKKRELFN